MRYGSMLNRLNAMNLPAMRAIALKITMVVMTLFAAVSAAHADIYGYLDADGTAHFSAAKLDPRYQLFVRGEGTFDSNDFSGNANLQAGPGAKPNALVGYLVRHPNLKKYEPFLNRSAAEFKVDPALLKAIMAVESGFNPTAVSPKGAVGLMQIMPATARRYGLAADAKKSIDQKLTDPATNIRLAARYLHDLRQMFPDKPELVIASYNAGEGAVQRYRNTVPPYPETRNYVQLVRQFHQLYRANTWLTDANNGNLMLRPKRVQMIIPGRSNLPADVSSKAPLEPSALLSPPQAAPPFSTATQ
jgi:soluble lytic murein transglycosylase-like protein